LGVKLGVNQKQIMEFIKSNNSITTKELANKLSISETAVENNIKKLKEF
jgi:DNA-binding MarR family transcriptional regulator